MWLEEYVRAAAEAAIRSGKTRYWISKESGIQPTKLAQFLSGERTLNAPTLGRLMTALGLEIDDRPRRIKDAIRNLS